MANPKLLRTAGADAYAYPLLVRQLLHNAGQDPAAEIVSGARRFSYGALIDRIHRLASVLAAHGVGAGDTVAVMDWDSHRYLECYFAIPMMGAVLQTVNVRLSPEVIAFTLRQTGAKVLLRHDDFAPIVEAVAPALPELEHVIVLSDRDQDGGYEALISRADSDFPFEDFDENAIATTFHTTGTTGDPKQVFFSHRQIVLHTLAACAAFASQPTGQGLRRSDVYMPMTPMFHVHAWGVPYVATMLGLKQVYPGRYDPARLLTLKVREGVTFSHGVPTLLRMVIEAARQDGRTLTPWTMVVGGSALPRDLADEAAVLGIEVIAGYGMSETGPVIALARSAPGDPESLRRRAGLPIPLVQVRLDPERGGELTLRAPWLTAGYADQGQSDALWSEGWLHTQDIAELDPDGGVRIVDRLKDVIKTGGEWVSSIEIEGLLASHPAIVEAAVIGAPSDKWGERPVAFVVAAPGGEPPTEQDLRDYVAARAAEGRLRRYATPDRVSFLAALPKTSVGKIDKKALRQNAPSLP